MDETKYVLNLLDILYGIMLLDINEFIDTHNFVPNIQEFNSISNAIADTLLQFHFYNSYSPPQRPFRPFWLSFFNLSSKGCNKWTSLMKPIVTDNILLRELERLKVETFSYRLPFLR